MEEPTDWATSVVWSTSKREPVLPELIDLLDGSSVLSLAADPGPEQRKIDAEVLVDAASERHVIAEVARSSTPQSTWQTKHWVKQLAPTGMTVEHRELGPQDLHYYCSVYPATAAVTLPNGTIWSSVAIGLSTLSDVIEAVIADYDDRRKGRPLLDAMYVSPLSTLSNAGATVDLPDGYRAAISLGRPRRLESERRGGRRREAWAVAGRGALVVEASNRSTMVWLLDGPPDPVRPLARMLYASARVRPWQIDTPSPPTWDEEVCAAVGKMAGFSTFAAS